MSSPRMPHRGERVHVDGYQGTFVVVRVDKVNLLAAVELWDDPGVVVWDLSFGAMHLIHNPLIEAA